MGHRHRDGRGLGRDWLPLPSATVVAADGKDVFTDMDGRYTIELEAGKQA